MADEARNVEILKAAYKSWSDTKGGSVDDWMKICADNIAFGSLAQGAAPAVQYMTAYSSRDALKDYFGGLARDWDMLDWQRRPVHRPGRPRRRAEPLHLALQENRQGGVDAEGGRLAVRRRQGGRVLRVLRHRAGPRRGGVNEAQAMR